MVLPHLMANMILSGTSRVHKFKFLQVPFPAWPSAPLLLLSLPWSSVVAHHSGIFATSSNLSLLLSRSEYTWKKGLGNKCKDHLAQGTSYESRRKAHCGMQRIPFTSCPSTELQSPTNSPLGPETIGKSGFRQSTSYWTRSVIFLRVLGRGHNSHTPPLSEEGTG